MKNELEMAPLKISTEQMIALHTFFAEAAAVGEARLGEISGSDTEVDVEEIRATPLGEFGDRGLCLSEDLVAGVMGRLAGVIPGSMSLVLEPEDALLWSRLGTDGDPLETFVALGSALLEGTVQAIGELLEGDAVLEGAALVDHVKSKLAAYKAPKRVIEVSSIGRAPNGKLDYKRLKADAVEAATS